MRWIFALLVINCLSSCYLVRAYRLRHFHLEDNDKVAYVPIEKPDRSLPFVQASNLLQFAPLKAYLDSSLSASKTAAFVVIRNDSLIYENYFNGFNQQSLLPSFSIAKSFVGTLVAIAVDEGKIKSTSEPITTYIPELLRNNKAFEKITIQHLLDMRSGIRFSEGSYNLKDEAVQLGFRPNILKHTLKLDIEEAPGKRFRYKSVNTQLLSIVLERATGKKLSAYMEEKLWKPLGAEQSATWNVDSRKRKQEIAFAGLNATARDFAKLGRLYLGKGSWQGKQFMQEVWVNALKRDSMEKYNGYKNQWWSRYTYSLFPDSMLAVSYKRQTAFSSSVRPVRGFYRVGHRTGAFSAHGMLDQILYINPANKVIIVRLGRFWSHPDYSAVQFVYHLGARL